MIGIFDSGSGGLTVLRAIREQIPSADVIYFGDIAHAPYGSLPREELSTLTVSAIERLLTYGATSIVSACNSVSASLAISLFDTLALTPNRLIEMVGPTVSAFRESTARITLVATPATVCSKIYQNAFRMIGKHVEVVAIPDLAGAIEFGASEPELERLVRAALKDAVVESCDTLVLACTHYPLVASLFTRIYPHLTLFDPAKAVAERVLHRFLPLEAGDGTTRFLISADSATFSARIAVLFPEASVEVVE